MQAFHNDPVLKEMYVQRMYTHKASDTLIQGEGWNGTSGCNIGCALEEYRHEKYPE